MSKKVFYAVIAVTILIVLVPILLVIFWDDGSKKEENDDTIRENQEKETIEDESDKPYIPKGFSHIDGQKENGYTIRDNYGNEYVWVPVESGELIRNKVPTECVEIENSVSDFKKSVAKYKGFYIAKYEASVSRKDDKNIASNVKNQMPIRNIDYQTAYAASVNSSKAFEYEDSIQTNLVNSYAWDTTIDWINQSNDNYSDSTEKGNYYENVSVTGGTESDIVNNICDLAGNVQEWSTEVLQKDYDSDKYLYRIVRGGGIGSVEAAIKRTYNNENAPRILYRIQNDYV